MGEYRYSRSKLRKRTTSQSFIQSNNPKLYDKNVTPNAMRDLSSLANRPLPTIPSSPSALSTQHFLSSALSFSNPHPIPVFIQIIIKTPFNDILYIEGSMITISKCFRDFMEHLFIMNTNIFRKCFSILLVHI